MGTVNGGAWEPETAWKGKTEAPQTDPGGGELGDGTEAIVQRSVPSWI
jgi:hypothetical protein